MKKSRFFAVHGLILALSVLALYLLPGKSAYRNFLIGIAELFALLWLLLFLSFLADILPGKKGKTRERFGLIWQAVTKDLPKTQGDAIPFGKRFLMMLLPVSGIVYMILFFGVTELFFANTNEWLFSYRSIFPVAAVFFVICILTVSVGLTVVLKSKEETGSAVFLFSSLFLAMYLQNLLLNGNGFIGGGKPEYSVLAILLNLLLWLLLCIVPFILRSRLRSKDLPVKICLGVTALLLLMQLVPLPMFFLSKKDVRTEVTEPGLIGAEQFTVSADKNVIVFIMDAYYNGFFEDYLSETPKADKLLADFTYYDNINTQALHTAFSVPYLMTASELDLSVPLRESNRMAWTGENAERFYSTVNDLGYRVYLYTDSADYAGGAENMDGKIANVDEISYTAKSDPWQTYLAMLKLSAYRYMPYFLKDFFFVYDSSQVNRFTQLYYQGMEKATNEEWARTTEEASLYGIDVYNHDYYHDLLNGLHADEEGGRIIFEHILGMHPPQLKLDGVTQATIREEEVICMEILYQYIEELQKLGLYDRTCIIVTADHGYDKPEEGDPVMLIKGFDEHGDGLRISSAPGCLQSDLLPTILDLIGSDPGIIENGTSLLKLKPGQERERLIRVFTDDPAFPPVPKCDADGTAVYNSYREYHYSGRLEEMDPEKDLVENAPIYDYWW